MLAMPDENPNRLSLRSAGLWNCHRVAENLFGAVYLVAPFLDPNSTTIVNKTSNLPVMPNDDGRFELRAAIVRYTDGGAWIRGR